MAPSAVQSVGARVAARAAALRRGLCAALAETGRLSPRGAGAAGLLLLAAAVEWLQVLAFVMQGVTWSPAAAPVVAAATYSFVPPGLAAAVPAVLYATWAWVALSVCLLAWIAGTLAAAEDTKFTCVRR